MLGDTMNKGISLTTLIFIQPLPTYTVFLSVFKSTAASDAWTFGLCVCKPHAHSQQNILSYSFSHSVKLPLRFTGVVFYLLRLCETVTFTRDTVRTVFQFTGAKAVPAHYFELLNSEVMFLIVWFYWFFFSGFVSASLQGSVCIWLCTIQTHAFHLSPKVW